MSTTTNEKGHVSAKDVAQTTDQHDTAARRQAMRRCVAPSYASYEALKSTLTAHVTTPAEYEAACRQAADLAGI